MCVPGSGAAGLGAPYQPLARPPGSPQRVRAPARVPRARPLFPPSPRPHVSALYRGHLHLNLFTLSMFFDRKSFKFGIVDSSLCFLLVKILTPHLTIFERRTRWALTSLFLGCSVRVRFGYKEQESWLVLESHAGLARLPAPTWQLFSEPRGGRVSGARPPVSARTDGERQTGSGVLPLEKPPRNFW